MIVLGINAHHADSSAAIFTDGILIAATEEERFTRVKHWAGFPSQAIAFCLKEAGISLSDVDHISIGRDPKAKFLKKLLLFSKSPVRTAFLVKDRMMNYNKVNSIEAELANMSALPIALIQEKIHHVEHHRSHLASAFYASPFRESALLSIDGSGDFTTTMLGVGTDNNITVINSIDFPHSLGVFYTAFTQFLGFPNYGDEYKVMGLAPYGVPRYTEPLKHLLHWKKKGLFELDLSYFRTPGSAYVFYENNVPVIPPLFSSKMVRRFGQPRRAGEPLLQYHKDLAASIQQFTEETIFHILNGLFHHTGLPRVCIAGGVAQNSVANGKITRYTPFTEVYIPSAGHDAGISMGAALYTQHNTFHFPRQKPIYNACTGSHFNNDAIEAMLRNKNITYRKLEEEELYDAVTTRLIDAGVVGWFSGKAEFGPRALGGRSILVDPRREDAKALLNDRIKRRESFRPFAPSILKEYVSEYFEVTDLVPFMEKVFPIRHEKRCIIPAVTHIDGTGRLQTVDKDVSPRYYALIDTFRQKTGIPILLNTSFNENEPIVNTPEEALHCFLRTSMDMLVMENIIIER